MNDISGALRSPAASPPGYKNAINLPRIHVPEMYHGMATPVSTPSLDHHHPSANHNKWSTPAMPVTPLQTPQSTTISSWPDDDQHLPSLKTIGENIIRPTSASNAQLPPLAPLAPPASQYYHYEQVIHHPRPHQYSYPPPPPPIPYYPQPVYQQYYPQPMQQAISMPTHYKTQILELASSREIKRRTKTGCLTCRKRRIKVCFFYSRFEILLTVF